MRDFPPDGYVADVLAAVRALPPDRSATYAELAAATGRTYGSVCQAVKFLAYRKLIRVDRTVVPRRVSPPDPAAPPAAPRPLPAPPPDADPGPAVEALVLGRVAALPPGAWVTPRALAAAVGWPKAAVQSAVRRLAAAGRLAAHDPVGLATRVTRAGDAPGSPTEHPLAPAPRWPADTAARLAPGLRAQVAHLEAVADGLREHLAGIGELLAVLRRGLAEVEGAAAPAASAAPAGAAFHGDHI